MTPKIEEIYSQVSEFCKSTHGSTNYDSDAYFIQGRSEEEFAPFQFISKKVADLESVATLFSWGFSFHSHDFLERPHFKSWFEKQFQLKFTTTREKSIQLLYRPNDQLIQDVLQKVSGFYQILRQEHILINSKNLPTQLGEWLVKNIFGLKQVKSTSQRGFDFLLNEDRVEVKVHWSDRSSPKGVKLKKSLLELSNHTIILYLNSKLMIRDLCFIDSDFILRKFPSKGHTLFLKDNELAPYFFSRSTKQFARVCNINTLMTYASPQLVMKLEGKF